MGCSVSGAINGNNRFRTATAELMRYVCLYLRARGENREEALRLSTLALAAPSLSSSEKEPCLQERWTHEKAHQGLMFWLWKATQSRYA